MIDYKSELNEQQYEAVRTTEGPVLILAVAGAGKTRTLIYRVAYLIEHNVAPESILLLTFTNKAAKEMKDRASEMIGERAQEITACTYHSFCLKMLRSYGKAVGIDPHFSILSSSDEPDVINIVKDKLGIDFEGFPDCKTISSVISSSINTCVPIRKVLDCSRYEKYLRFACEVERIAKGYKKYKKEHDLMDFDDLLTEFIRLLKTAPAVRQTIDDAFRYIMVDEYQDSNSLQDEILTLMRKENRNLAVVGDDMQSLYGFRGADVGNILTFSDRWKDCKTITLFKNYRSGQEILDFANDMVETNLIDGIFKKMEGNHSCGQMPKVVEAYNKFAESEYIIKDIKKELSNGRSPSDIAILARNSFASQGVELALTEAGLPYVKYGGAKFMDKDYVRDITALWKCLVNEKDEISWYRILKLFSGIADRFSERISEGAGEKGADILLEHPYKTHKFADSLKTFRVVFDDLRREGYPKVLDRTIEWYHKRCKESILAAKKAPEIKKKELGALKRNVESLSVFKTIAEDYKSLSDFVDGVLLDPPDNAGAEESIVLSTIHSAKGLEWPVVYVIECVEGRFPRIDPRDDEETQNAVVAEELRCMYVAVTRAKEGLTVTFPKLQVTKSGFIKQNEASEFLDGTEDSSEYVRYRSETSLPDTKASESRTPGINGYSGYNTLTVSTTL